MQHKREVNLVAVSHKDFLNCCLTYPKMTGTEVSNWKLDTSNVRKTSVSLAWEQMPSVGGAAVGGLKMALHGAVQ